MARRGAEPRPREIDDAATRLVARLRVLVVTALTLVAALALDETEQPSIQYVLAYFSVPGSVALALAADRLRPVRCAALGAALDVALFAVAVTTFPMQAGTLGAAFLVAVMVASYTGGRGIGTTTGAAGLFVLVLVDARRETDLDPETVLLLTIAVVVSLAVVGRADARLLRTARRARYHEARATLLLEHLAEPICVTDAAGTVTLLNDAARELLGTDDGRADCAAVLGLHVDGAALDCASGCGLLRVEGSRSAGGIEAVSVPAGGTRTPVLASVAEVMDSDGDVREVIHTLRDITRLKQADEAKTLFLATATHELKTPLTVIRGFLDTIEQPAISDEVRTKAMSVMRVRAMELSAIIERLLLASRIEAGGGGIELKLVPVDTVAIARERIAALAGATGRLLSLQAAETPPAMSDETSLATILDHLLDNACKYSAPQQPIQVTITHDDTSIEIAVRDLGEGMSTEQMLHCFDRFWQADLTSRRKVGGTGIGLYIVRSLAASMQGTVTVASEAGEGTTFTVTLRRADAPDVVSTRPSGGAAVDTTTPEPSIVREFMRQIGVEHKEVAT
jgi:PAS domain S-box-containing protein